MKSMPLKTKLNSIAVGAIMLTLTSCCSDKRGEPVLNGGYLTLQKGQTYQAPADCTLVDLEIVEQKDTIILDLLRAQNKQEVSALLEE